MNTISVTIPPPPPVVSVSVRRPTNPPPPPPVSNNLNPFVATRQLPRTPVRNSQNIIYKRKYFKSRKYIRSR